MKTCSNSFARPITGILVSPKDLKTSVATFNWPLPPSTRTRSGDGPLSFYQV